MISTRVAEKQWDGDGVPLEESNVAGIGSEEDKALRHEAASAEPAWEGVGQEAGLWIWRIEDFKVVPWPAEKHGNFHAGDSYIVLHAVPSAEDGGEPVRKIYFWLGESTSTDEKGTAAYKSVELDDFFHGKCSITREVMLHESKDFYGLFPKGVKYLQGGVESGFDPAMPDVYLAKLFRVRKVGKEGVRVREVPLALSSLCQEDSFILDGGTVIYVWNGEAASPFEKHACNAAAEQMEARRHGKAKVTLETDENFWALLGGEGDIPATRPEPLEVPVYGEGVLFKVSMSEGQLSCEEVGRGELRREMLDSTNLMMLDASAEVIVWIGAEASHLERRNALPTAVNYLRSNGRSADATSIHLVKEGDEGRSKLWQTVFSD